MGMANKVRLGFTNRKSADGRAEDVMLRATGRIKDTQSKTWLR